MEVLPQDVGIGLSQLVPVAVLGLEQRLGLSAIEQPELHLPLNDRQRLALVYLR